jgi:hypothetical protein
MRTLRALQQAGCIQLGSARQITIVDHARLGREVRQP